MASKQHVKIVVYDILGSKVATLLNSEVEPGLHQLIWDAKSESGKNLNSGLYFYTMFAGDHVQSKRMLLIK